MFEKVFEKIALPEDTIITEANPENAIKIITEQKIDLVITDLVMPNQTGLDILRVVKETDITTEVIVITGQASIDSALEAMKLGARDYLTKPLNYGMFIEKIKNIREFIARTDEAEEYRYAKEIIEENASRTVADMEIKLDRYISLVGEMKKILNSNISNEQKISNTFTLIKQCEKSGGKNE